MCMLSKSFLRISVAMAVAMPNCIGVDASVQAAIISCSPNNRTIAHVAESEQDEPKQNHVRDNQ